MATGKVLKNFDWRHRLWQRTQMTLTPFRWPARLADRLGLAGQVGLSRHEIVLNRPLGSAASLRIAFAADFHAGPATSDQTLDAAVRQLQAAKADLALLGGDFVSPTAKWLPRLARLLSELRPRLGCYAVLGNHDYWADSNAVQRELESIGVRMLTNQACDLPAPFEELSLIGLDDYASGHPDADAAFQTERAVRIVLMHQPSSLLDIGSRPFDVALAGHTHGGQVCPWPGFRPIMARGPLSRRYPAGWYSLSDSRRLLVTRGVGCTGLPLRLNSPPEVHLIEVIGRPAAPESKLPSDAGSG